MSKKLTNNMSQSIMDERDRLLDLSDELDDVMKDVKHCCSTINLLHYGILYGIDEETVANVVNVLTDIADMMRTHYNDFCTSYKKYYDNRNATLKGGVCCE